MSYDSPDGTVIVFCGAGAGYAGAFMNRFTLQAEQGFRCFRAWVTYQLGNVISNVFTPTSGFFRGDLALAKILQRKWVRWILPLIGMQ